MEKVFWGHTVKIAASAKDIGVKFAAAAIKFAATAIKIAAAAKNVKFAAAAKASSLQPEPHVKAHLNPWLQT